jgi:antitoxin VapB
VRPGLSSALPEAFRFDSEYVYINRDEKSGDVFLSKKPKDWSQFFSAVANSKHKWSFDKALEQDQNGIDRDPLAGWQE